MAPPKYQHTIQLPDDVEQAWQAWQAETGESFNAFTIRLIRQKLEVPCALLATSSTIR
jgi:hypothetical protein